MMWNFLDWMGSPNALLGDGLSVRLYRFTA
jgi:hypothetical protein